ncbi:hypothetical protein EV384_1202 [Micromonospora kangleipakensis]|uniref:Uncharacterized protein n=1 Tax=Micromonospora kangleipakensis TaxID=1077942 RepID=A0A4Q8B6X1_9ACTN|nr:hypothetical protein EV384_1202 [Micromonospora kangleipakensis]
MSRGNGVTPKWSDICRSLDMRKGPVASPPPAPPDVLPDQLVTFTTMSLVGVVPQDLPAHPPAGGLTTLTVRMLPDSAVTVACTPWPATLTLLCGFAVL